MILPDSKPTWLCAALAGVPGPALSEAQLTAIELAVELQVDWVRRKRAACDLSEAHDWKAASKRPSHAELQRRRAA